MKDEMTHPAPDMSPHAFRKALGAFLEHTAPVCSGIEYRLVGTGAALLHGVALPASDIDILAGERSDVDALCSSLSAFRCIEPPSWLGGARQYYANYEVEGIEVGISTVEAEWDSDTGETVGPGPWKHFVNLECGGYAVPAVALELRLITELFRNRPDRYLPIIRFMVSHGCDTRFMRRGMEERMLPQGLQAEVLEFLTKAPFRGVVGAAT